MYTLTDNLLTNISIAYFIGGDASKAHERACARPLPAAGAVAAVLVAAGAATGRTKELVGGLLWVHQ